MRPDTVRADEGRLTPLTEQGCEGAHHILGGDRAPNIYAQTLPAVLVHHWHHLQPSALLGYIHHEVVAPDVANVLGAPPCAAVLALAKEEAPPLVLPLGHFETFLSPKPIHPLLVDRPTLAPQQRPHTSVAVARILPREGDHPFDQPAIPLGLAALVTLAGPGLSDHSASPTLRDPQPPPNVLDGSPPPSRAQKFPRLTSFRMSMSNSFSASSFLRRAFSFSSSLRRFASLVLIAP